MAKYDTGLSSLLATDSQARVRRVVAAWATRAIPLAASGRLAVVAAVEGDSQPPALIAIFGSLLARGYLDSRVVLFDVPASPRTFENTVTALTSHPGGWLSDWHLQPVSAEMASRLVWGLYLTSVVFKSIDRSRVPAPGQGLIPAPPGQPSQWLDGFLARFGPEQLDVAREIARRPDRWQGPAADRPDVPCAVSFELQISAPLGLRASLERLPEFQPYHAPDQYMWLRREPADPVDPSAPHRIAGILQATPGGGVVANVASASAAAALAARLEELTRERLSLRSCMWYPHESSRARRRSTPDRTRLRPARRPL